MDAIIDQMLRDYETGKVSRRALLGAITGLATSLRIARAESPFSGKTLNHVTVNVSDLNKSKKFYTGLLGLPVLHDYLKETPPSTYLGLGKSFLCLQSAPATGIDHFCVGLESYSPSATAEILKSQGVAPEIEEEQVYFRDPDGIRVQLASAKYNG